MSTIIQRSATIRDGRIAVGCGKKPAYRYDMRKEEMPSILWAKADAKEARIADCFGEEGGSILRAKADAKEAQIADLLREEERLILRAKASAKEKEALRKQETWIVNCSGMTIVPMVKPDSTLWRRLRRGTYGRVTDADFQRWKAVYEKWLADQHIDEDDEDYDENELSDEEEYDDEKYRVQENWMFTARPELEFDIERAPWPPEWKAVEKSPQYLMGMIDRFVPKWALEDDHLPEKEDSVFCFPFPPPNRRHHTKPPVDIHRTLKKFLKQVRESRGYDLEVNAPCFMQSPFSVLTPYLDDRCVVKSYHVIKVVTFAVAQINKHAHHAQVGKNYLFLKCEKFVNVPSQMTKLVTFTAEEVATNNVDDHGGVRTIQAMVYAPPCYKFRLMEWRFKPDDE